MTNEMPKPGMPPLRPHSPVDHLPNNTRTVLRGYWLMVEIRSDGTGVVREIENGRPTAITSAATSRIENSVRALVDQLAEQEAKTPAGWSP